MSLSLSLSVSSDPFGSPKLFFFGKRVIFFPQLWCPSLDRNLFGVLAFPTRSESFCGHLQMIPRRILLVFVFFRPPIHNPAPPPKTLPPFPSERFGQSIFSFPRAYSMAAIVSIRCFLDEDSVLLPRQTAKSNKPNKEQGTSPPPHRPPPTLLDMSDHFQRARNSR